MKLWKWFIKCPMLFLLLLGWFGLTAFTWSEGRLPQKLDQTLIENPAFTALLEPEEPDSILDGWDETDTDDSLDAPDAPDVPDAIETMLVDAAGSQGAADAAGNTDGTDRTNADGTNAAGNAGGVNAAGNADGANAAGNAGGADALRNADAGNAGGTNAAGNGGDAAGNGVAGHNGTDGKATDSGTGNGAGQPASAREEVGITRFEEYKKQKTDSRYYSDPGKKALTTEFSYQEVDKGYFDDAVFIGDSRTVGMKDYSGLDNAQFFAKTGMNVYEVLEDKFITDPKTGKETSVAHMLKTYRYGKIYFMVGINELGTGNTGTFQQAYGRVLRKFRKWQPDAVIYAQGIIPVSKAKALEDEIFNNININDKNVAIAQLADGKDIFYLDVSKKLTDKAGYLKEDYTFDEVHMYAQYYELWTKYLMKHAVVR